MEEFPREVNDEKAELVVNRLYDQIMYEDKDVHFEQIQYYKI